jgi:hypothetical protein
VASVGVAAGHGVATAFCGVAVRVARTVREPLGAGVDAGAAAADVAAGAAAGATAVVAVVAVVAVAELGAGEPQPAVSSVPMISAEAPRPAVEPALPTRVRDPLLTGTP